MLGEGKRDRYWDGERDGEGRGGGGGRGMRGQEKRREGWGV